MSNHGISEKETSSGDSTLIRAVFCIATLVIGLILSVSCVEDKDAPMVVECGQPREPCPPQMALDFDGDNSYINTGATAADLAIANDDHRTIEAWVYTREFNEHAAVFSVGQRWGSTGADFSLLTLPQEDRWRLVLWNIDIDFSYPSKDRWVHFAVVFDGAEIIVYADGNEIAWGARDILTSARDTFRIGHWDDSLGKTFDGMIAEVRVWNRALGMEAIKARMGTTLKGNEEGLTGYWPLDDGKGSAAREIVADHTGELAGEPEWVEAFIIPFSPDLPSALPDSPGRPVTLGPVELRDPRGTVQYQWYHNGDPIAGATGNTFVITDMTDEELGVYHVDANDERDMTPVTTTRLHIDSWPVFAENLPEERVEVGPGESIVLGPVELLLPQGEVVYQWYFNDEPISNASGKYLAIEDVSVADLGTYHVIVNDESDATPVSSGRTTLRDWPVLKTELESTKTVTPGELVIIGPVELYAPYGAVEYQWYHNDGPIEGAVESFLQIDRVSSSDLGRYHVSINDEHERTPVESCRILVQPADKWVFESGSRCTSTPAVSGGIVYSAGHDGMLYAVNTGNGTKEWVFDANGAIVSSPAVCDLKGAVFVADKGGFLYSVNIADGGLIWSLETGGPVVSSPVIADGMLFVGSNDNKIYAVDIEDGSIKWTYATGGAAAACPVVGHDGTVYAGSYDGHLYALDPLEGSLKWSFAVKGLVISTAAVGGDGTVYVGCSDNYIYALDPVEGNQRWRFRAGGRIRSSPLAGRDGVLYAGSMDGRLYALNATDGTVKWSMQTGGPIESSPAEGSGNIVYTGSTDRHLYAVNAENGAVIWLFGTDSPIRLAAPVAADDGSTVYVSSYEGNLYAVEKFAATAE